MHPLREQALSITRRTLLSGGAAGIGSAALASLLAADAPPSGQGGGAQRVGGLDGVPHFAPRAKRVIYMLMSGAPSQVDLLDYKPNLEKVRGDDLPESVQMGQRLTTMTAGQAKKAVLPSIAPFRQHGECGTWISDYLPHTGSIADDMCLVRSLHTEAINHAPAVTKLLTGSEMPGRPSMGAWLSYGLGNESADLPTFCAMTSRDREGTCGQLFYDYYWGSGFLPTKFQGVKFREKGTPVLYLENPAGLDRELRRGQLDDLAALNGLKHDAVGDPEIQTRIAQYEMAFRMQASVPALADFSSEPQHVLDMYGPDVNRPGSFARNCLLARRLSEQGVRFVQLMHAGWDQHQNLPTQLIEQCKDTDQPAAALVKDLKQRGLLDETLVIWGGEFGRTVFCQGDMNNAKKHGRDHHPRNFCIWMAGGGVKAGSVYGESDEFSYNVAKDPVHVHDLQATILHLLGIDHLRLTFKFQGRHYRLTDVHGQVVEKLLA
ncbi:MAG: DUF1501 domain-containing protein [Planctomycetales bacterium]|nr:DUF1501 domain-containing protein [Planctomycetales bacterium]